MSLEMPPEELKPLPTIQGAGDEMGEDHALQPNFTKLTPEFSEQCAVSPKPSHPVPDGPSIGFRRYSVRRSDAAREVSKTSSTERAATAGSRGDGPPPDRAKSAARQSPAIP